MKTAKRTWKLQAGVSLLEVLVTVMIVTGGLMVVMSSFVGIAKSNRYVTKMELANTLLRLEMENIRNASYADIISTEAAYGESYSDQPDFRRDIVVEEVGNIKRVTVMILFDNDYHRAEAATIVTQL